MTAKAREASPFASAPEPVAPRNWNRRQKALFRRVVESFPPNHFRQSDEADLKTFVLASLEADDLERTLFEEGLVLTDAKTGRRYPHPAAILRDRAWVRLSGAATKLRIHLSSRARAEDVFVAAKRASAASMRPWDYGAESAKPKRNGKSNGDRAATYFEQ
ncbi:hypothetical protein NOV72_03290 [Caballeronia novacaledonica]|uniref:Uncharacterized protein n=2 Tax=Caballeronia novacaledonica TaxID=1544861 RepID=A0A2U3I7D3_9BURK|nr:hypothetical protein NOV72_03290 [Caballeronia novacaledonica]